MSVYLDYNASAPVSGPVLEEMIDTYKNSFGNADSRTHDFGERARKKVETARQQVGSLLDVRTDEIFFTSGATESNNSVILGLQDYGERTGKKHIITTSIEHHSVLNACKELEKRGFLVDYVNPDSSGRVSVDEIISLVQDNTLLVTVMHVNNETGIIQPVKEIGSKLKDRDVFFHVDATQSVGKLIDEVKDLDYDMLSCSAHKLQGPQGVGTLVMRRRRYVLPPVKQLMFGGQQERGFRPGTTPVALVSGFGKACEIAEKNHEQNSKVIKDIKGAISKALKESGVSYKLNGDENYCVDSCLNISFDGISSEALMLSTKQYCGISNGSACDSKSYELSYVLRAMGLDDMRIEQAVRMSWGPDSDKELIITEIKNLLETIKTFQ